MSAHIAPDTALLRALLAVALALMCSLAWPAAAWAIEFRSGDDVRVGPGETISGDLYAAGGQVTIEGRVTGDLFVGAGAVRITGPVDGSITIGAGDVRVSGPVGGSARIAAGAVTLESSIARDVLIGTNTLTTESSSLIGGDVVFGASTAMLNGSINGMVRGGGDTVTLNGAVARDVSVDVGQLNVGATARIGGDLRYESSNEASIAPAAQIAGQRIRIEPPPQERPQPTAWDWFPGFLLSWLMPLILGGILIALWPVASGRLADQLTEQPLMSLVAGILVLVAVPFVVLLLLITVVGIPAALVLLMLYLIALYVSQIIIGLTIGAVILRLAGRHVPATRRSLFLALALGLLILAAVHALPVPALGTLVTFFSLILGLGALWLALVYLHRRANQPAAPAAP